MNVAFLLLVLKSLLWSAAMLGIVRSMPAAEHSTRRRIAVFGVWGLLVVPWLEMCSSAWSIAAPLPNDLGPVAVDGTRWLCVVWVGGVLLGLVRLAREWWLWRRRIGRSTQGDDAETNVRWSAEVDGPCVVGALHPVILMPCEAARWPLNQWLWAVKHERQHCAQHDGLHRLVGALVRAVWWWNPLAHALCRRLELESEIACDIAAVGGGSRRDYGVLLLALATHGSPQAVAWASRHSLSERIERLMQSRPARVPAVAIVAFALVATTVALGATIALRSSSMSPLADETQIRLSAEPFPAE